MIDQDEKKKIELSFMQSTLSPGGKLIFNPGGQSLEVEQISNPFIEKSDIVNHKKKI